MAHTSLVTQNLSPSWERVHKADADALIDAYLRGKAAGSAAQQKVAERLFNANLNKATSLAQTLYYAALQHHVNLQDVLLKVEDLHHYSVVFVTPEKDFLSDTFRQLLIEARQTAKAAEGEKFYFSYHYLPASDHLDTSCLESDGYVFKYDKRGAAPTRTA